jgi:hypothetical protein
VGAKSWGEFVAGLALRLANTFAEVEAQMSAPREDLERPPGHAGWSALEAAEHVALANHHLLLLAEKIAARSRARLARGERPPEEPSRLDSLEKLASRAFAWESPEHMLPAGGATPREIAACLREQRRRCLALLARMPGGEGALHRISMSVVGARLDLYQYLGLIALHMERHARQMARALDPGSAGGDPAQG